VARAQGVARVLKVELKINYDELKYLFIKLLFIVVF
jgi:hypothetical protein